MPQRLPTQAELGIWLGHQSCSDPAIYNCAETVTLTGPLCCATFEAALRATLAESPALRCRYVERSDGVWTESCPPPEGLYALADLTGEERPEEEVSRRAEALLRAPLRIEAGESCKHRLFRVGKDVHVWLHVAHHIALDGYGFHLFRKSCEARYAGRTRRPAGDLEGVRRFDVAYEESSRKRADELFWTRGRASQVRATRLSARREPGARLTLAPSFARRETLHLDERVRRSLSELARPAGLGWVDVLLAGIAGFIARETGRSQLCLGLPVMLRLRTPAAATACMAMNINRLPLVVETRQSLIASARTVRRRLELQAAHQRFRYEQLRSPMRREPLFGPLVNVLPFDAPTRFGPCECRIENLAAGPAEELSIAAYPEGGRLRLDLDAHPEAYGEASLKALGRDLVDFLGDQLRHPLRPWQNAAAPPTRPGSDCVSPAPCVLSRIAEQARRWPDHPALIASRRQWSYGDLWAEALGFARWLQLRDCCVGDCVALDLPRCPEATVFLLGTLAAGCSYFALDESQPEEKKAAMLEQARPTLVVRQLPESSPPPCPESVPVRPMDPAYLVFTSGSTGGPKGIEVPRAALDHFVRAARGRYGVAREDRVLQFASLAFDASVEEIFVTLSSGATLIHREASALDSLQHFAAACEDQGVTFLDLPTAFFHELCWALRAGSVRLPPSVRTVVIGGEAAAREHVLAFRQRAPGVRLLNTYGPSEATVVATTAELHVGELPEGRPLSIGSPLAGVDASVRNERGEPVVPGEPGELWLSGPTLASGYVGRDDWTEQAFPYWRARGDLAPKRHYRTRDRVRREPDGQLTFLGRLDDELKISGYRVRPAEVEAVLSTHPAVRACLVLASSSPAGTILTACVEAEPPLDAERLANYLKQHLAAPMIPSRWIVRARLPKNVAGKLDREPLRALSAGGVENRYTPESELDRHIFEAWEQVLGAPPRSLDDNFFERGGSSLQVIQLVNRLASRRAPAATVATVATVAMVFENPTPRKLAAALDDTGSGAATRAGLPPEPEWRVVAELPRAWFRDNGAASPAPANRVLLTGATGFLGRHLLGELLDRADTTVVCLVRARSDAEALERLLALARYPGLRALASSGSRRLEARACSLDEVLSFEQLLRRAGPCGAIVHCAAEVSLTRDYQSLEGSNVRSTRQLLELAAGLGASMHYVSTLAVAPRTGEAFPEAFVEAHEGLRDGYQRSKWHGEALCERAARLGLPTAIYRLGRICGPRTKPSVNEKDLVWRIARASARVGCWPELDISEPWMPADDAASSIAGSMANATTEGVGATYYNFALGGEVHLGRVRDGLRAAGCRLQSAPLAAWARRVGAQGDDEDRATLAFFELAGLRTGEVPAMGPIDCDNVRRTLGPGGCRPVEEGLLQAYCRAALARFESP